MHSVDFTATTVEIIIEDDEALSSLCLWWGKVGSYFAIAREINSAEIHCEFCDQANGFYSKAISFLLDGHYLIFRLCGNEIFDKAHIAAEKGKLLQEIRIDIQNVNLGVDKIEDCLASIFRGKLKGIG